MLLVSFDSRHDTPAVLKEAARAHGIDDPRWTLAHAQPGDVRTIAALLGIRYREPPEGGFDRAKVLLPIDARGRIAVRTDRLGSVDPQFVGAIRSAVTAP